LPEIRSPLTPQNTRGEPDSRFKSASKSPFVRGIMGDRKLVPKRFYVQKNFLSASRREKKRGKRVKV
jgi:hypothetical protein